MKIIYTSGEILTVNTITIENGYVYADDIYIIPVDHILRIETD